ncbi:aldose sugar dehydrogenase YliI [Afipia sp. P52-10]|uniref:PQQ-dependent sugar dehydrogenase n=1 Tax=Afipia sp. P52-10 TaxID=1429916 RepID=UPI0003DF1D31|nr:PQQ-dependent sugar dehydrogenase [Afipia sp. P52-10]ETR77030.1 aldose sugar dehydrogenase YliI [Afipia sp. P52-10]
MKTPLVIVTATLSAAIAVTASLLIVTATRGANATFESSAGPLEVETAASGLVHPWGLAFLPDGRMLVTERPGRLRVVARNGQISPPVAGVPGVWASGQGGLLDVALDKDFAGNAAIYLCYAERTSGGGRTAVTRATFNDEAQPRLTNTKVIFRQEGPLSSGNHFGCRFAQGADGNLFVALGDHFGPRDEAQNLANHLGKIVRIAPDGAVPKDNPFVGRNDAKPEIWSYGHRNVQALALHPVTGRLWEIEHGPRGGDEVNVVEKGKNYGWPVIGYGVDYSGAKIHQGTAKDGMEQPVKYWVPSIAPSGMAFYTGNLFPAWRGSLFTGALAGAMLVRLSLDGEKVTGEERLLQNLSERIRDVRQGPDGALWLLTDSPAGRVLRVSPAKK